MKTKLIDWHTHILPSMDDGSHSPEESFKMLQTSYDQGVEAVVLTPHFYPHRENPERFLKRRARSLESLEIHLAKTQEQESVNLSLPSLISGAEVFFFNELAAIDGEMLRKLCIGNSNYLMIELLPEPWCDKVFKTLETLIFNRNIIPVLAHIDRYFSFIKDPAPLMELINYGMLIQLNTEALYGHFSRKKAVKWIDRGLIQILASDCHNLTDRPPNLGISLSRIKGRLDEDVLQRIISIKPENK